MKSQIESLRMITTGVLILSGTNMIGQELPESQQERREYFLEQLSGVL